MVGQEGVVPAFGPADVLHRLGHRLVFSRMKLPVGRAGPVEEKAVVVPDQLDQAGSSLWGLGTVARG